MNLEYNFIIYHADCSDGTVAQWASTFSCNTEAIMIPIKAGTSDVLDVDQFINQNVLFVDITPTLNIFDRIIEVASYLTILDHHKTGFDDFSKKFNLYPTDKIINYQCDNYRVLIDMNRAACQIAWEYFNNVPAPWFVDYVADRDLYVWRLKNSKDINSAMFDKKLICNCGLNKMLLYNKYDICQLSTYGATINEPYNNEVKRLCTNAKHASTFINNKTYNVWLITCSNYYKSDVGNKLASIPFKTGLLPDFVAIFQHDPKSNDIWISLRGINDINLDELARLYDKKGGGHQHAAGFTIYDGELNDIFTIN